MDLPPVMYLLYTKILILYLYILRKYRTQYALIRLYSEDLKAEREGFCYFSIASRSVPVSPVGQKPGSVISLRITGRDGGQR